MLCSIVLGISFIPFDLSVYLAQLTRLAIVIYTIIAELMFLLKALLRTRVYRVYTLFYGLVTINSVILFTHARLIGTSVPREFRGRYNLERSNGRNREALAAEVISLLCYTIVWRNATARAMKFEIVRTGCRLYSSFMNRRIRFQGIKI